MCRVPVKGVVLYAEPDWKNGVSEEKKLEAAKKVVFSDNCLDLVPREVVRVYVHGIDHGTQVMARYLGMDYPETLDARGLKG